MSLWITRYAIVLSFILIAAFTLSLIGRYHWFFALLCHFKVQYFAGGIILFVVLVISNSYFLSICVLIVSICSYAQTRVPMTDPWTFTPPEHQEKETILRVAQYNKYYKNRQHVEINKALQTPDLIIMQEAVDEEVTLLQNQFSNSHPFTLPENSPRPNSLLILSKFEIKNLEFKSLVPNMFETIGVRFEILPDGAKRPIVIYTVHTEGPFGHKAKVHEAELREMAIWILQDQSEHIIFIGDLNTTPFTPTFQYLLKRSKLNYQSFGVLPEGTWPSFFLLPIFKIPIDHILFSDSLSPLSIKKDRAMGSDHHSLLATFELR